MGLRSLKPERNMKRQLLSINRANCITPQSLQYGKVIISRREPDTYELNLGIVRDTMVARVCGQLI